MLDKITNFPLCLAPMVGLSHVAMREALRVYLPQEAQTIWPTEMLSSYKLPSKKISQVGMLKRSENEKDLVPQILGNEKKPIEKSIKVIQSWGAVGVDLNMGCPVKKALKHNYGVSLMGDPNYAAQVVSYAVEASDLPVSVKFRAGQQKDLRVLENFAFGVQDAGASWLCLHPRTASQKRRGRADWDQIRFLKERVSVPLIGNGDVQNLKDVFQMKERTGCDMVMVGRALTAKPWLFWQLGESLGFSNPEGLYGSSPQDGYEEGEEFGRHMKRFISFCYRDFSPEDAQKKINFYARISHVWLMFGHDLMSRYSRCKKEEDFLEVTDQFFSKPQKMMQETSGAY